MATKWTSGGGGSSSGGSNTGSSTTAAAAMGLSYLANAAAPTPSPNPVPSVPSGSPGLPSIPIVNPQGMHEGLYRATPPANVNVNGWSDLQIQRVLQQQQQQQQLQQLLQQQQQVAMQQQQQQQIQLQMQQQQQQKEKIQRSTSTMPFYNAGSNPASGSTNSAGNMTANPSGIQLTGNPYQSNPAASGKYFPFPSETKDQPNFALNSPSKIMGNVGSQVTTPTNKKGTANTKTTPVSQTPPIKVATSPVNTAAGMHIYSSSTPTAPIQTVSPAVSKSPAPQMRQSGPQAPIPINTSTPPPVNTSAPPLPEDPLKRKADDDIQREENQYKKRISAVGQSYRMKFQYPNFTTEFSSYEDVFDRLTPFLRSEVPSNALDEKELTTVIENLHEKYKLLEAKYRTVLTKEIDMSLPAAPSSLLAVDYVLIEKLTAIEEKYILDTQKSKIVAQQKPTTTPTPSAPPVTQVNTAPTGTPRKVNPINVPASILGGSTIVPPVNNNLRLSLQQSAEKGYQVPQQYMSLLQTPYQQAGKQAQTQQPSPAGGNKPGLVIDTRVNTPTTPTTPRSIGNVPLVTTPPASLQKKPNMSPHVMSLSGSGTVLPSPTADNSISEFLNFEEDSSSNSSVSSSNSNSEAQPILSFD